MPPNVVARCKEMANDLSEVWEAIMKRRSEIGGSLNRARNRLLLGPPRLTDVRFTRLRYFPQTDEFSRLEAWDLFYL